MRDNESELRSAATGENATFTTIDQRTDEGGYAEKYARAHVPSGE